MTSIFTHGSTLRLTGPSPEPQDYFQHGVHWFYLDYSAQEEPLMHEELTRYGQPISCSITEPGLVFISYGYESLYIRDQIRIVHDQEHFIFLNETDIGFEQDMSLGWDPSSPQRLSAFAAGYPASQPVIDPHPRRTIEGDPQHDLYHWYEEAITTFDLSVGLLETEDSNFFNDPSGTLPMPPQDRLIDSTETLLPTTQIDAQPVASEEPSVEALTPIPHVIETNYQQRIDQLKEIADDEDIPFSGDSVQDFWIFIKKYRPSPQAGLILTDDGNLVAIWREATGGNVEVEFLGDKQCKLIVFKDPNNPLRVLPEISTDTLASIGQQIGELSFLQLDR